MGFDKLVLREYIHHPPGTIAVVASWFGGTGFMVSLESRPHCVVGKHPCVHAVLCADAGALLDAVAAMAQCLAAGPAQPLRITLDDGLDAGLSQRCAFLLLAGAHAAQDLREAA
ncbi:hypothetical protein D2917_32355 (plasmid) [Cupriavidus oxalaticus]|uniref:Uncharacterized protein n=1 Tax=Cupriavidus oxalaticus TaxID=96344 RepID=A0A5P3VSK2_9BURK|nr:hypothetical protein D2917_32355 [Cupriavidus oxalaticus]